LKSHLNADFIQLFQKLPNRVKRKARKNYKLWRQNKQHPSLEFKRVHTRDHIYSIRIGIGWRALGVIVEDCIVWFWIGSHNDYEKLLHKL